MQKIHKKYIPLICLVLMLLISWVEESVVVEGLLHNYLYVEGHVIVRSFLRIAYVGLLFLLGFIGLKTFSMKWIISLWIIWYAIVLLSAGFRMMPLIFFQQSLPANIWSFLNSFYAVALSPFPFIFLWLLAVKSKKAKTKASL